MDHEETVRRCYELLNAGDVDGFGDCYPTTLSSMRRRLASNRRKTG